MKARTLGSLLLLFGFVMLVRGRGPGGLLVEFLWLGALVVIGAVLWRALLPKYGLKVALIAYGAVAVVAVTTLKFLAGPGILAFIAVAFWLLYRGSKRARSWALVPFGIMATVAAVAATEELIPQWDSGIVFLLGMTATFTAVYLLPKERGGARWALWPALVWAFITLTANDPGGGLARWMVPLALIGAGVVLLGWAGRKRG